MFTVYLQWPTNDGDNFEVSWRFQLNVDKLSLRIVTMQQACMEWVPNKYNDYQKLW